MNILDIYKKYEIMPQLAEHQLKVAAVGKFILNHLSFILNREEIVAACLLHDMGNIVKFNFDSEAQARLPKEAVPVDLPKWIKQQQQVIAKYGPGSHNVTMQIVDELGVNKRIRELVDCVGFSQAVDNAATADFGKKICAYSDMRVMPGGVSSLQDRMADLRVRYKNHPEGSTSRETFEAALRTIEKQIFEHCKIKPEDISEISIREIKESLKDFQI